MVPGTPLRRAAVALLMVASTIIASMSFAAAGYAGTSKVDANGATALASTDITAFKVVGSDGATLVWVPATWTT